MPQTFEEFAVSAEAFSELLNEFVADHPTELRLSGSRYGDLIVTMRKVVSNLPGAVRNCAFELEPAAPIVIPEPVPDEEDQE